MDFAAFIPKLQALEGGADLAKELEPVIEEYDKNKDALKEANKKLAVLGDRDVGKMVALVDTLKENELDTPAKIVDFKNHAEGLEKTVAERDKDVEDMKGKLEARETQVKEDADRVLLLADAKVALSGIRGSKETVFNNAVETEMSAGKFSRGDKGILFDGKPLADAHDYFRDTWGNGFADKPSGTGNPPTPKETPKKENKTGSSTWADVVSEVANS